MNFWCLFCLQKRRYEREWERGSAVEVGYDTYMILYDIKESRDEEKRDTEKWYNINIIVLAVSMASNDPISESQKSRKNIIKKVIE